MFSPQRYYPEQLFEPLASSDCDVDRILHDFHEILFAKPSAALDAIRAVVLIERPPVARLVLSRVDKAWIVNAVDFPVTPDAFAESCPRLILSTLATYFQFTPSAVLDLPDGEWVVGERRDQLRLEYRQLVQDAPALLMALKNKMSSISLRNSEEESFGTMPIRQSQKQMKRARQAAAKASVVIDLSPLDRLGVASPSTTEEVYVAIRAVLDCQKNILNTYLTALQSPELSQSLVAACLLDRPVDVVPSLTQNMEPVVVVEEIVVDVKPLEESYPVAQPMKLTTFYNNNAKGLGEWTMNLSPRAERDLRDHRRRDHKIFKIILKKIKELSNGHFSPDNQKRLNHKQVDVPVYEAKMTGDLRLVYQIDCIPAYESSSERQAIKIFGIYTHAQIGRVTFWDTMGRELAKKGREYRERCAFRQRPFHAGDHVFAPGIFPAPEEARTVSTGCAPDLPPDDLEQVLPINFYLYLIHLVHCIDTSTPIASLSLGERPIIDNFFHRKSVHFSQPLLDSILKNRDAAFILQVSPTEQDIIEHPHSCYVLGRSGTGKTTTMLYKMVLVEANYERSNEELNTLDEPAPTSKPRQLFVTQSRILAEKVEEHYRKLSVGYQVLPSSKGSDSGNHIGDLMDADDDPSWRNDLPDRFSELKDEHFPLFLTYEKLSSMVENDMDNKPDSAVSVASPLGNRLTFDRFLQRYWPHFTQSLTKGIDPAMVYSEFLGVIMGSEETLSGESMALTREAYLALSERAQSTFADQRELIYTLFESYRTLKKSTGDLDAADRTHTILRYLDKCGVPGKKIDYLYVDESQDNLLIDTLFLRSICHNPNGLFWAGDTAQTISVGSSFRFNELKAFLFRIEKRRRKTQNKLEQFNQPELQPRTFQLTVNYRSHAGIVNCAHSVIEIMTMFWPYAIDILDRERGTVDGLRPVFFTGFDSSNVEYEQFLFGDKEGSYIEFGAQQCILVRDEAARERLREQVGDIGLIMTLYESKGLEFNDVLLYNFFEDSTVGEAQWRVVLNAIDEEQRAEAAPTFDQAKHAGVCVELKFLYVAITRARNNVWIADTSDKGEPMRTVWSSRDQVQTLQPGQDTPRLAMSSTPEEWEDQGRKLFANKRYRQSKHCFERAQMPRLAAMAGAYYARQEARKLPDGPNRRALEARKAEFRRVADAFMDCAREDGNVGYFRIAAQCLEEAGDELAAAQVYRQAKDFTRSTELYRKLGNFDEAVYNIKNYKSDIKSEVLTSVTNVARLYYFKEQKPEKAQDLFESFEEQLEYLEDRGLDVARATLLESLGRYSDAAEVHLEEGRSFEAIKLFLRDRTNPTSTRRGIECVLLALWKLTSFNVIPSEDNHEMETLLGFASQADIAQLSERHRNELSMFKALHQRKIDLNALASLSEYFDSNDPAAALLCVGHYFKRIPRMQVLDVESIAQQLKLFYRYVKLLNAFVWVDPCSQSLAVRLFGLIRLGDNEFVLREGTFLHSSLRSRNNPVSASAQGDFVLNSFELREFYHVTLKTYLRTQVQQENELCKQTKAFSPCLMYTVFGGNCNRPQCLHEHVHSGKIDSRHYNTRVRIHLLQILILDNVQYIDTDFLEKRKYWISRLYSVLYPPYYRLGSAAALDLGSIPEAEAGLQVARQWVRSLVYDCEFLPMPMFLSNLAQITKLSFQFDRRDAMSFLKQGPYMLLQPPIYMRSSESYIVGEFLQSLEAKTPTCICAGVLFVRHVVTERLDINASMMCDIVEHLCACMLVAVRQEKHLSFHGLTMPLSWLTNWSSVVGEGERFTSPVFQLFLQALEKLIERLYSGVDAGHLLFQDSNLHQLPGMIRDVFLVRVCRCIALMGYNSSMRDMNLRNRIHRMITAPHRSSPHKVSLSYQFVTARRWSEIVPALCKSTQGSAMDELVQLIHPERPPIRGRSNVRQIVYSSLEAIPHLLGSASRAIMENLASTDIEAEQDTTDSVPIITEEEDVADFVDIGEAEAEAPPVIESGPIEMPPALEAVERTDEEVNAAITIQRIWRHVCWRVECRKEQSASFAGIAELYISCQAEEHKWPPTVDASARLYRLRFLGPLPHLLFCLGTMQQVTQQHKIQAKKDLLDAKHEKLDAVDKQLTDLSKILKQLIQLQKTLAPSASTHRARDLGALKRHVSQAATLLSNLPFKMPDEPADQLKCAYRGIVQPKTFVQAAAKPKPTLNIEDLDGF
ncbi:UvrD-like helicase ATP-binding domain-containing protein [Mycena indigotica]|uniref:UvrD-like helicase ATP-binding domain-containing protein n=1 Tax=Mycena indigotica TaxID=2126181 RepID=A0A8H6SVQ7_9AGAR|nr:UvrD-like helicase ATP-binding domain-containing protein [Mycena indigotica]KAF7306351.1 UvrD-like helicase ATP-binding domain-containing protein [Mycena indigotica]